MGERSVPINGDGKILVNYYGFAEAIPTYSMLDIVEGKFSPGYVEETSTLQMNPDDMSELKLKQGDLVEVYNENGSTQAMVYPTPTAKRKQTFMLFANPNGVQGNVVSPGVNEFVIPNYKQTWGNIRKLADAPEGVKHLSFKSLDYTA